jgi:hypothetical protein
LKFSFHAFHSFDFAISRSRWSLCVCWCGREVAVTGVALDYEFFYSPQGWVVGWATFHILASLVVLFQAFALIPRRSKDDSAMFIVVMSWRAASTVVTAAVMNMRRKSVQRKPLPDIYAEEANAGM